MNVSSKSTDLSRYVTLPLHEIAPWIGDRFRYQYDLGDKWTHDILVENILPPGSAFEYPVCLSGKGACPPEDCGGIRGYSWLVHSLRDRRHEERKDNLLWVGGKYEADAFGWETANRLLKRFQSRRRVK